MGELNKESLNLFMLLLIMVFFYNIFKLLNTKGNEHLIMATLFNIIIILALLLFILNKNKIKKEEIKFRQTYLDKCKLI